MSEIEPTPGLIDADRITREHVLAAGVTVLPEPGESDGAPTVHFHAVVLPLDEILARMGKS